MKLNPSVHFSSGRFRIRPPNRPTSALCDSLASREGQPCAWFNRV